MEPPNALADVKDGKCTVWAPTQHPQWTREDDVHHDYFHACSIQHVKVGLSAENKVTAWNHHSVFPSICGTSSPEANEPSGQELGMIDFPYDIPAVCIETHEAKAHTRIG